MTNFTQKHHNLAEVALSAMQHNMPEVQCFGRFLRDVGPPFLDALERESKNAKPEVAGLAILQLLGVFLGIKTSILAAEDGDHPFAIAKFAIGVNLHAQRTFGNDGANASRLLREALDHYDAHVNRMESK